VPLWHWQHSAKGKAVKIDENTVEPRELGALAERERIREIVQKEYERWIEVDSEDKEGFLISMGGAGAAANIMAAVMFPEIPKAEGR